MKDDIWKKPGQTLQNAAQVGSLLYMLKHHPNTVPYRSKKHGLGWRVVGESKTIYFFTEYPDMATQEILAAQIKARRRKERVKR